MAEALVEDLGVFDELFRPLDPAPKELDRLTGIIENAKWADPAVFFLRPLEEPTDAQLRQALTQYVESRTLLAGAQIVYQYGAKKLAELTPEGRRWLYWELTQTLVEDVL